MIQTRGRNKAIAVSRLVINASLTCLTVICNRGETDERNSSNRNLCAVTQREIREARLL